MKRIVLLLVVLQSVSMSFFSCNKDKVIEGDDMVWAPQVAVFYVDKNGNMLPFTDDLEMLSAQKDGQDIEYRDGFYIGDSYCTSMGEKIEQKKSEYFLKWKNKRLNTVDSITLTFYYPRIIFTNEFLFNGKPRKFYDLNLKSVDEQDNIMKSLFDNSLARYKGGMDTVAIIEQETFRMIIPVDTIISE